MPKITDYIIDYYILSDFVGDTAEKVATEVLAQFPFTETILHNFSNISTTKQLDTILEQVKELDGLVFLNMIDTHLAEYVVTFCKENDLGCYNLIQPIKQDIERRTGLKSSEEPSASYKLSDEYFRRIAAMEFAINYDDGKNPEGLFDADVVLLGISRTGKTPLAMYLANKGFKVANLPLIPENQLPRQLFEVNPKKIIGLTNVPEVVHRHRHARMLEYGLDTETKYASKERVEEELEYARNLYKKLKCPELNVADRSIEESANIIIDLLNLRLSNRDETNRF